jgi:hypothetical protein
MNLFHPFKELKSVNRNLSIAIVALFVFFASEMLVVESFTIYSIFSGYFDFSDLLDVFVYSNFVSVISFIILYLAIRNSIRISKEEKEKFLVSLVIIVFAFNYIFKFFFIERIFSLTAIRFNSLPDSITDFLPFDWFDISQGYKDFRSDFDPGWYKIRFLFALISVISILVAIFFSWAYIRTSKVKPEIKKNVVHIKTFFEPTKTKVVSLSVVMIFFVFGIQNVKADDYRAISYEAEFAQDDLIEFQEELKVANQIVFQSDKYEARKAAASKVYTSISSRDERLKDLDLSLWSSNMKDLQVGIIDWMLLWEKFLKEMSLQGYVEPGTLFDLNQKYAEVSKLGQFRAPELVSDYSIEYWEEEFFPLVK